MTKFLNAVQFFKDLIKLIRDLASSAKSLTETFILGLAGAASPKPDAADDK